MGTTCTKEPARKVKLPIVVAVRHKRGRAYERAVMGPLIANPLKGDPKPVVELSDDSEGEHDKSTLKKILKSKHYNPYFIFWQIKKIS